MKRTVYIGLTTIVVLYAGARVAAFLLQRSLIYVPQPRQIKAAMMRLPVEGAELIVSALSSTLTLLGRFHEGVASMTTIPGSGHNDLGFRDEYGEALRAAVQ